MLDLLRRGVKTWVAKVLFGLLVVSFAIWGIGDVFSGGLSASVATVGDQEIKSDRYASALNREIRAQSARFGQPVDVEMARALGIPQQVLARMAQEATLDQQMAELGVSAPDDNVKDMIVSDPTFRNQNGDFDQEGYRYTLAQNDFTVEAYEELIRRSLARSELAIALSTGGVAPKALADAIVDYQTETRRIDYIVLEAASLDAEIGEPDEAALSAYHEANAEVFTAPETRDATFLRLDLDVIGKDHEPDEADLQALYDARALVYDQPERRALYQIVFDDEESASAAAARIAAGDATFDDVLAERGETRGDTDLGELTAADLPTAAGEAAFALAAPGVAGPVDTGFGFALVDVAAITPAEVIPFEDARAELAVELRREAALDLAPELAGEIDDRRASGATLEEIAAALGLTISKATGVARDGAGADGFAANPAFLAELFAAEPGEERDIIETDEGGYFVLRVEGVTEAALRPLDDVRSLVETGWRVSQVRDALTAKAQTYVDRLNNGAPMAIAAGGLGLTIRSEGPKTRLEGWEAIPAEIVEDLFEAEIGAAAQGFAPGRADAVIIARLSEIKQGEANEALSESVQTQMDQLAGDDALTIFITAKQTEAGVSVNQQRIESLLSTTR